MKHFSAATFLRYGIRERGSSPGKAAPAEMETLCPPVRRHMAEENPPHQLRGSGDKWKLRHMGKKGLAARDH